MPLGLRNVFATFQSLTNSIFFDSIDALMVEYVDYILIYSENKEKHIRHLRTILIMLQDHMLFIRNENFEILRKEAEFSRLKARQMECGIDDERKNAIQHSATPTTISKLQSFLGILQYFQRFIKDFLQIKTLLTIFTRNNSNMQT